MKMSADTLMLLGNFASINQNIFIAQGNKIKTKAFSSNSLIVNAEVEEVFPHDFAIYELSKFLTTINLFEDPELEFNEKNLQIQSNNTAATFAFSEPALIDGVKDYDKEIRLPATELKFVIHDAQFKQILKSAKLFDAEEINIASIEGSKVRITAASSAISTANSNKFQVDLDAPETFTEGISVNIKLLWLNFMPGDYEVKIGIIKNGDASQPDMGVCQFRNITRTKNLEYIIAGHA